MTLIADPATRSSPHSALRTTPRDYHSLTADLGAPINMADRLRHSPVADCLWLGQEDLKVVGTHPIDAGGFADVWIGELDNRKVAIKSYRCSASADYSRICGASSP